MDSNAWLDAALDARDVKAELDRMIIGLGPALKAVLRS